MVDRTLSGSPLTDRLFKLAIHLEGLDSGSGDAKLLREAIHALQQSEIHDDKEIADVQAQISDERMCINGQWWIPVAPEMANPEQPQNLVERVVMGDAAIRKDAGHKANASVRTSSPETLTGCREAFEQCVSTGGDHDWHELVHKDEKGNYTNNIVKGGWFVWLKLWPQLQQREISLPPEWRATRWDEKDGDIAYHAYGPKESFVVFEGVNAKADCQAFMKAVEGHLDD